MNSETITSYKGFNDKLQCTPEGATFQYVVGDTYTHEGEITACKSGFHACEYPLDVFGYYAPSIARYCITEQSGALSRKGTDSKVASSIIKVSAEIGLPGLIKAAIEYTTSRCKPIDPKSPASNSGDYGAASNSGDYGAASNSGDYGAASNSGTHGAASNSGYQGAAMAAGYGGRVKGSAGSALFLTERDEDGKILSVWAGIVGQNEVRIDTWYTLKSGQLVVWKEEAE